MRLSLLAAFCLIGTGSALAQSPAAKVSDAKVPDAKVPAHSSDDAGGAQTGRVGQPLEPGANSFTEAQVKERFDKMGFGEVKDLRKDESGIWRGTAQHAGKSLTIGMDFHGNVAAQ